MWWRFSRLHHTSNALARFLLIACATVGCASRCGEAAIAHPANETFEITAGQDLFLSWCAPCHGDGGRGDGANLSAGAPAVPPDLASDPIRSRTRANAVRDRLRSATLHGENHCPPWGHTFSTDEIDALARHVEHLAHDSGKLGP